MIDQIRAPARSCAPGAGPPARSCEQALAVLAAEERFRRALDGRVQLEGQGVDFTAEALQAPQRLRVLDTEAETSSLAAFQFGEQLPCLGKLGFDPRPFGTGEAFEPVAQRSLPLGRSVRSLPKLVSLTEWCVLGLGEASTPFAECLLPFDGRLTQLGLGPDGPAVALLDGRQLVPEVSHPRLGSVALKAGVSRDDGGQGVALGDQASVAEPEVDSRLRPLLPPLPTWGSGVKGPADSPGSLPRAAEVLNRLLERISDRVDRRPLGGPAHLDVRQLTTATILEGVGPPDGPALGPVDGDGVPVHQTIGVQIRAGEALEPSVVVHGGRKLSALDVEATTVPRSDVTISPSAPGASVTIRSPAR